MGESWIMDKFLFVYKVCKESTNGIKLNESRYSTHHLDYDLEP